jgi:hypothetical protein
MCIISHGCRGWLFISIICKYGDISTGVGILVMLPGYAYVLFMSVSSPPLAGVYGILCCMHLVRTRLVCERRAESVDLESGERRRDKNSKLGRLKLGHSKNRLEYSWNILESINNSIKNWTYFRGIFRS